MIAAGVTIEKALESLVKDRNNSIAQRLTRALGLVRRGVGLSQALKRSDCLNGFDVQLLATAEAAGCLPDGLNYIAERRLGQQQRVNNLTAALVLPQAVLLIGAFAAIFVRINSYQEPIFNAVVSVAVLTTIAWLMIRFSLVMLRLDARYFLSWLWPIGVVRNQSWFYQATFELLFYRCLLWQLKAGEAVQKATERCQKLLTAPSFQAAVHSAADTMGGGTSVPESLRNSGLVLSRDLRQVMLIADESGRWEQAIAHELTLRGGALKQRLGAVFKWLPRVYYLCVLVFIVRFLF